MLMPERRKEGEPQAGQKLPSFLMLPSPYPQGSTGKAGISALPARPEQPDTDE